MDLRVCGSPRDGFLMYLVIDILRIPVNRGVVAVDVGGSR
jgi:hypothetical protein